MTIELLKELLYTVSRQRFDCIKDTKSTIFVSQTLWQILILMRGQSLFRSYGRFFAEFLSESSLVGLGLLDPSTCVGLRYGRQQHKLISFSSQRFT